ncbi:MAG TPA: DUF1501 domain-containing protein, partial [Planctomycetaceae bacterium]|nr:DUF1501 domain-containing protein [Planctomycetaceae bacterium]
MLSILDPNVRGSRRDFLRIGGLSLGGLTLSDWLRTKASAATRPVTTDKSVVFLFMHGGPSQIETFDPKMTAPSGIHSINGEVQTALPGVTFGATFPKLAQLADKLTVVRSFTTGDANHDIKPIVGADTLRANLGSLYARVAGTVNSQTGMPINAALFPQAVNADAQPMQTGFGRFTDAGAFGSAYAPFLPGSDGPFQESLKLTLPRERLDDRRKLRLELDRIRRTVDVRGQADGLDKFQEQAIDTILRGVADAFDLSKEDPKVVARYDTAPLIRPEDIDKKLNNYKFYVDHTQTLGKLLLLSRRLCEAGCRFVTVTTNFVWDNHADVNNAGVETGMRYCGVPFDHAVSAFLEDLEARGLSEKILLVCCGEMGRTPRINNRGGRDHWGNLAPLLLSGGGL